jgi:hypothetical protein
VAKPKRKPPKGKSIAQHQLFPAVVALWFGALLGLGSLAVRPSLLEALVIKSRIDLLIPAAAPPLGMTARMLVALGMAALGALIGMIIARYMSRPRQEPRDQDGDSETSIGSAADADVDAAGVGVRTTRRRSLALEHEEDEFGAFDMAPLPGGAPQIFDIAAAGLDEAQAPQPIPEPVPAAIAEALASPVEAAAPAPAAEPAPEPAAPSLDSLGITDLSARLVESMRRRRVRQADQSAPALPEVPAPHTEPAEAGAPQPLPAALRPLDLSDLEHDTDDSLLPPRWIAVPADPAPQPAMPEALEPESEPEPEPEPDEDTAASEQDYASLLEVAPSPPVRRNPFMRARYPEGANDATEPVVIFPGQAMSAPPPVASPAAADGANSAMPVEETQEALRSALAKLQRMNGAV